MNKQLKAATSVAMKEYTYTLPAARIASYPLKERDASKLLVYDHGRIHDSSFREMHQHLDPGTMLVLNNTRVVQARLEFFKSSGARIEIFCLHPSRPSKDVAVALGHFSPVQWYCLVGNAKKWKTGELEIRHPGRHFSLVASLERKEKDGFLINFRWEPSHLGFAEVLALAGKTPLPPYITRAPEAADRQTYQTVFASDEGSVAAPTAGLHFTPDVFQRLDQKGIDKAFLTLHVGAGTFKPVVSNTIGKHMMHEEQFMTDRDFLQRLLSQKGPLLAVGTTSLRTIESLYWLGAKIGRGHPPRGETPFISQWEPYEWKHPLPSKRQAIKALLHWMEEKELDQLNGNTALIIVPGYVFQMTDILATNFHQPGSTLLLLVAAFAGEDWKKIYQHALDNDYRFLSYGDGCLLFRDRGQGVKRPAMTCRSSEASDIFGRAFKDFMSGKTDGMIRVSTSLSAAEALPVAYFFRSFNKMPEWEKLVMERCRGRVLDVGAGAGSHALALQDKGLAVCAIDVSAGAVEVMERRGVKNVQCRNFFRLQEKGFDTILFLMNGAGMAGTLDGLKKLLTHARKLLNPGGAVYLESTDLMYMYEEEDGSVLIPMGQKYYGELEYHLGYEDLDAEPFPWLFVDPDNLAGIAARCGMHAEIIYQGVDHNYVAEIVAL